MFPVRVTEEKKLKQSSLNICNANRFTIITFKEISVTSPSVQTQSQILTLCRGS